MPHHLRYSYCYCSDETPLWPDDVDSPYGYPCEMERLPISAATRAELTRLAEWYNARLDWANAPATLWAEGEQELFRRQADAALVALRDELGSGWTVDDGR